MVFEEAGLEITLSFTTSAGILPIVLLNKEIRLEINCLEITLSSKAALAAMLYMMLKEASLKISPLEITLSDDRRRRSLER